MLTQKQLYPFKGDPIIMTESLKNKVVRFKDSAFIFTVKSLSVGAPSETPLHHRNL